jgi:hypothetical protein
VCVGRLTDVVLTYNSFVPLVIARARA